MFFYSIWQLGTLRAYFRKGHFGGETSEDAIVKIFSHQ